MSHKVAIASSDGKFVNQHFGRAQQFLIVELRDDGSYEFLEPQKPMVFGFRKCVALENRRFSMFTEHSSVTAKNEVFCMHRNHRFR